MSNAKERILKLAEERNRAGRPIKSSTEVLENMQRIRDGALSWIEQCVIYGKTEGIKEAQMIIDHAIKTIAILERSIK